MRHVRAFGGGRSGRARGDARVLRPLGLGPRRSRQLEGLLAVSLLPEEIEALGQLLDRCTGLDFAEQPLEARTALVHTIAASGPEAKLGVRQLRALTLFFFYGLPDEAGHNDNWDALGFPARCRRRPRPSRRRRRSPSSS